MLRELLKDINFLKIIKKFLEKQEIADIILFGSAVRGKESPEDLDILIVYHEGKKSMDIEYDLRKKLEKINEKAHITGKSYSDLFTAEFAAKEAILSEGFSMKAKKFLAEAYGYKNFILFKYSLKNMNKSKRMLFYYGLYGRGKEKGILEKNSCIKFSDSVILCPPENSEMMKEFLKKFKVSYSEIPALIPERAENLRL